MSTFLSDIQAYVGFGDEDVATLHELHPVLEPHFRSFSEHFYARILAHPRAHAAITGGEQQIERLKQSLVLWMDSGLLGPHDEAFYERRARIGRVHVHIGLPQQYMVTAINVMRVDYRDVLERELAGEGELTRFARASAAIDRLFDIELAIMLHTYRVDSEERLRRRERLATLGQIAASIGHDLRNPLGVMESSLFLLRKRHLGDDAAMRHIDKIGKQVSVCGSIVSDLLDLAREQPLKLALVEAQSAYAEAVAAVSLPNNVRATYEVPEGLSFEADPGLLQRALVNLVTNAVSALESRGGTIALGARAQGEFVALTVADDGTGFDPAVLPHAFEPLVTTRTKGTGLGLALVKGVVERHGGEAIAENITGGGARVILLFPVRPARPKT